MVSTVNRHRFAAGSLVAIVLLAAGCSGSSKTSETSRAPTGGAIGAAPAVALPRNSAGNSAASNTGNGLGAAVSPAQPQIVRTGDVHVTVGPGLLQKSFDQVAGLVTASGGFVSDSDMSSGGVPSARLVLRVTNDHLTSVVAQLSVIGHITQQTLQGQDVTGQVVDLNARITVLQSEEGAVRTLLARASAIGDLLQIQNQLFTLQTQIEQMDGQRTTLASQTAWATLSVEITEAAAPTPAPVANRSHRKSTASRSWQLARDNTIAVVRGIAIGVGWAAPVLVFGAAAGLVLLVRRRRHTRAA